jgi:hypothetical protein
MMASDVVTICLLRSEWRDGCARPLKFARRGARAQFASSQTVAGVAGVEMAPAEKLSGRITAATQTAASTAVPREARRLIESDMGFL